jgi:uncharacterized MAPEG superfamily protein
MTLITWLLVLVASLMHVRAWLPRGLWLAFGNRDNLPEPSPVAARTGRAAKNTLENLVFFAALVLTAHAGGADNAQTLLGAQIFVVARLVYIPVYMAGIPVLRTLVWAVSIVGLGMIALEILKLAP